MVKISQKGDEEIKIIDLTDNEAEEWDGTEENVLGEDSDYW